MYIQTNTICNLKRVRLFALTIENKQHIDGLVENCSITIANALEILHSSTKQSISQQDTMQTTGLPAR